MADPVPVQLPSNPFQFYRVTGYLNTFQTNNLLATSAKRITQLVTGIIETVLIPLYALIGICILPGFTRDTEAATLALHNKVVALEAQKQLSVDEVRQSILDSKAFQDKIERMTALAIANALRSPKEGEGEKEKGEVNPIRESLSEYIADNHAHIESDLYGTEGSEGEKATEGLIKTVKSLQETLATLQSDIGSLRERVEENSPASSSGKVESSELSPLPDHLTKEAIKETIKEAIRLADELKEKNEQSSGSASILPNLEGIIADVKQIQEALNGGESTDGLVAAVESLKRTLAELQSSRPEREGSEKEVESETREKIKALIDETLTQSLEENLRKHIGAMTASVADKVAELRAEAEKSESDEKAKILERLAGVEEQLRKLGDPVAIANSAEERIKQLIKLIESFPANDDIITAAKFKAFQEDINVSFGRILAGWRHEILEKAGIEVSVIEDDSSLLDKTADTPKKESVVSQETKPKEGSKLNFENDISHLSPILKEKLPTQTVSGEDIDSFHLGQSDQSSIIAESQPPSSTDSHPNIGSGVPTPESSGVAENGDRKKHE